MYTKTLFCALGIFLFSAPVAFASVRIIEIAWMGTAVSGTDEWIELYNSGDTPIDLSGWKIDADDGSPSIVLSGTVLGSGYFLLERTDDKAVPNIVADVVTSFGNGLGNSGETLKLKDAMGTVVDTVVGGADWVNIGGDNISKQTAQRTANSWVTGTPTPRASNIAQDGAVLGEGTSASSGTTLSGGNKQGFSGAPLTFTGSSGGLSGEALSRATYRWSFGDGTVGEGRVVQHAYDIDGDYVVTSEVSSGAYQHSDRLSVRILDLDVVLTVATLGEKGYLKLENRTERDADLSGWIIERGDGVRFIFPQNSFILPKKTFTLSNKVSGFISAGGVFALRSPNGAVVFTLNARAISGQVAGASMVRAKSAALASAPAQGIPLETPVLTPPSGATGTASAILWEKSPTDMAVGVGKTAFDLRGGMKWAFVLLTLLLIVLAGFLIARSNVGEATAADEYAIIEDIIEGREDLDVVR